MLSKSFLDFQISQGSVAIYCRWGGVHREFSVKSIGERILKIGPHLPKLLTNIKWLPVFKTQCSTICRLKLRIQSTTSPHSCWYIQKQRLIIRPTRMSESPQWPDLVTTTLARPGSSTLPLPMSVCTETLRVPYTLPAEWTVISAVAWSSLRRGLAPPSAISRHFYFSST